MHGQLAFGVFRIANRNKDDIALITLNVLEVLNKEWLVSITGKKRFELQIVATMSFQLIQNRVSLADGEGSDA